ncbi:MAG TPA: hypothetical protein VF666_21695 [Pyrinomonadaceae bacterium]|jgi:Ca2+/H+ antiporter
MSSAIFYVVFIVALTLACAAAVGFAYVMFLDGVIRQHKRRIAELEQENTQLARRLEDATEALSQHTETDAEWWPEVVDEDDSRVR